MRLFYEAAAGSAGRAEERPNRDNARVRDGSRGNRAGLVPDAGKVHRMGTLPSERAAPPNHEDKPSNINRLERPEIEHQKTSKKAVDT